VCVNVYTYAYIHKHTCVFTHIYTYIYTYQTRKSTAKAIASIEVALPLALGNRTCVYICIHIYTYIHIHIHIHIYLYISDEEEYCNDHRLDTSGLDTSTGQTDVCEARERERNCDALELHRHQSGYREISIHYTRNSQKSSSLYIYRCIYIYICIYIYVYAILYFWKSRAPCTWAPLPAAPHWVWSSISYTVHFRNSQKSACVCEYICIYIYIYMCVCVYIYLCTYNLNV